MRSNMNMEDPAVQERIRRGPHVYEPAAGKHGSYRELTPEERSAAARQQYPKIMDTTPTPNRKLYKTEEEYEVVKRAWDEQQMKSIVHNKQEEEAWRKEHPNPVTEITVARYPKTMDKTPAPKAIRFATLEEFRAAKKEWEAQVTASIVHDEEEEALWKREHKQKEEQTA